MTAMAHPSRSELYERAFLTERQRRVLELYDAGLGYKSIAKQLGIAKATVRDHLEAAEAKIRRLRQS